MFGIAALATFFMTNLRSTVQVVNDRIWDPFDGVRQRLPSGRLS